MSATWLEDLATHVNEIAASMRHDANALEDISEIVESAVDAITPSPDVTQARQIANRVNAAAVHAMTLVAGLQRNAGRLEGLSHVHEMREHEVGSAPVGVVLAGARSDGEVTADVWRTIGIELDEMQEQELGAIREAHEGLRQRLQVISLETRVTDAGEARGSDPGAR